MSGFSNAQFFSQNKSYQQKKGRKKVVEEPSSSSESDSGSEVVELKEEVREREPEVEEEESDEEYEEEVDPQQRLEGEKMMAKMKHNHETYCNAEHMVNDLKNKGYTVIKVPFSWHATPSDIAEALSLNNSLNTTLPNVRINDGALAESIREYIKKEEEKLNASKEGGAGKGKGKVKLCSIYLTYMKFGSPVPMSVRFLGIADKQMKETAVVPCGGKMRTCHKVLNPEEEHLERDSPILLFREKKVGDSVEDILGGRTVENTLQDLELKTGHVIRTQNPVPAVTKKINANEEYYIVPNSNPLADILEASMSDKKKGKIPYVELDHVSIYPKEYVDAFKKILLESESEGTGIVNVSDLGVEFDLFGYNPNDQQSSIMENILKATSSIGDRMDINLKKIYHINLTLAYVLQFK
jgi:hypothetical protein